MAPPMNASLRSAVHLWVPSLLYLIQMPLFWSYITDDTYIYARFARNLARHGELSFNPGDPVHAATSPLWAGLVATVAPLGIDPIHALKWGAMLCGLVAVVIFGRLAGRLFARPELALLVTGVFATEPWMVRWSASGMETALGVAWLLSTLDVAWRSIPEVRSGRLGVLLGLGFLIRPEFLLLSGLIGLAVIRQPRLRSRPSFWLGALLPLVAWAAYALPTFGHLLPATLQAKSTPLGMQLGRLLGNLRVMGGLFLIAAPLATAFFAVGLVRRLRSRELGHWLELWLWIWAVALPVVYLARDVQVISRYLEAVLPVVLLLGLRELVDRVGPRPARWLLVAQIAVAVVLTLTWVAPRSRDFGRSLDEGLGDLATWIREETDEDALVAIYDIGLVGHRSERRILDLGGLTHAGINQLRNRVDDSTILLDGLFLDFATPDYLVDRAAEADVLDGRRIRGYRLEALRHRRVANLGLSRPEAVIYTLYRLLPADS